MLHHLGVFRHISKLWSTGAKWSLNTFDSTSTWRDATNSTFCLKRQIKVRIKARIRYWERLPIIFAHFSDHKKPPASYSRIASPYLLALYYGLVRFGNCARPLSRLTVGAQFCQLMVCRSGHLLVPRPIGTPGESIARERSHHATNVSRCSEVYILLRRHHGR